MHSDRAALAQHRGQGGVLRRAAAVGGASAGHRAGPAAPRADLGARRLAGRTGAGPVEPAEDLELELATRAPANRCGSHRVHDQRAAGPITASCTPAEGTVQPADPPGSDRGQVTLASSPASPRCCTWSSRTVTGASSSHCSPSSAVPGPPTHRSPGPRTGNAPPRARPTAGRHRRARAATTSPWAGGPSRQLGGVTREHPATLQLDAQRGESGLLGRVVTDLPGRVLRATSAPAARVARRAPSRPSPAGRAGRRPGTSAGAAAPPSGGTAATAARRRSRDAGRRGRRRCGRAGDLRRLDGEVGARRAVDLDAADAVAAQRRRRCAGHPHHERRLAGPDPLPRADQRVPSTRSARRPGGCRCSNRGRAAPPRSGRPRC